MSGVPQGSVLEPLLFILVTADMRSSLENKIVSYTDDTTLYSEICNPLDHVKVADSLNRFCLEFKLGVPPGEWNLPK